MYTYVMGRLLEELKEANKITDEDLRLIAICNIIEKQIAASRSHTQRLCDWHRASWFESTKHNADENLEAAGSNYERLRVAAPMTWHERLSFFVLSLFEKLARFS